MTEYEKNQFLSLTIACIIACVFFFENGLASTGDGYLHVYFLDIGQGDSTLIQTPNGRNILIDAGPKEDILKKNLKTLGVSPEYISPIIISHPHADHYAGIYNFPVKDMGLWVPRISTLVFEEIFEKFKNSIRFLDHKTDFLLDQDLIYDVIAPIHSETIKTENLNNASSVALLQYKEIKFLFTGDMEDEGWTELLKEVDLPDITVLKSSHHGSQNGWTEEMLSQIQAEYAVISSGKNNKFKHPHKKTLEILENHQMEIFQTAQQGIIEFITDGKNLQICHWKNSKRHCQANQNQEASEKQESML